MLLLEKRRVLLDRVLLVSGYFAHFIDRVRRTRRNTSAAIHALFRIDVHLRLGVPTTFVALRMNAVVRARVNAKLIFRAGIGDYVCHSLSPGLLMNCRRRDSEPCSTLTRVENHVPTGGDSNHPPVVTHFTPNFLTPVLPHPYRSSFRAIGWELRT